VIAYAALGTNALTRAARFYDQLLAILGARRIWESERSIGWSTAPNAPAVSVIKPYDGNAASVGNGMMVALLAGSPEQVVPVHRKALELGGKDEGPAGQRAPGFHMGYSRDLDGNKLAVAHFATAAA
jgi:hypothetical protein